MRVLIVDDEEDIRKVGKASLEGVGNFETHLAHDAVHALEIIPSINPDVILMDMMMPKLDGLEALKKIKADPSIQHIPVIFMSAKVQPHEIKQYLEAGAIGVIEKPFDPMTLPADVQSIIDAASSSG